MFSLKGDEGNSVIEKLLIKNEITDSKPAIEILKMFEDDISSSLGDSMFVSKQDLERIDVVLQTINGLSKDYERLHDNIVAILIRKKEVPQEEIETDFIIQTLDATTRSEREVVVSYEQRYKELLETQNLYKEALEEIYNLKLVEDNLADAQHVAAIALNKGDV